MNHSFAYNNIGLEALAILFVVQVSGRMNLANSLLILPILLHKGMLANLSRANVEVLGIEKYLIEKTSFFSNFNNRYYDSLIPSFNAIQLLVDLKILQLKNGDLICNDKIGFEAKMGKRAQKFFKASSNVAALLQEKPETLYLNTRVQL